ncbi:MAG: YaiI/YqxD family protein [Pseudomonadota bacterium]
MAEARAPRLFVDADACPVKEECLRVAGRHGAEVLLVSNGGIRPVADPLVQIVVVPDGPDEADKWIADRTGPGDICITADIPLAARVVESGARVLKPNGEALTAQNVGQALAMRDLMTDLRAANPLSQGGGQRPFSKADRSRFLDALERQLRLAAADRRP